MSSREAVSLSALCLLLLQPRAGYAQVTEYFRGLDGRVFHAWHNGHRHDTGDTLRIRAMVTNAGDATLTVGSGFCDALLSTGLVLDDLERQCSSHRELQPADSAWVSLRGTIASPPGEYRYALEAGAWNASSTISVMQEPPARRTRWTRPTERTFLVIDFSTRDISDITRQDVESVAIEAILDGSRNLVPVPLSPTAAERVLAFAPYLEIGFHRSRDGRTRLGHCWVRERGRGTCSAAPTEEGPFELGVRTYRLVQNAVRNERMRRR